MSNVKILRDNIKTSDNVESNSKLSLFGKQPVLRTQILGGHGLYVDKNGISHLNEVIFEEENQIVLGGAMFILEKVFNIKAASPQIPTLNSTMQIDAANHATPYPNGRKVCLFGVGTGGAGDTLKDVKPVKFYEDALTDMIPFRVVDGDLQPAEKRKYFFKKQLTDHGNKNAFYLKKFETDSAIKVLYKDGEDGEDGSPVTNPKTGPKLQTEITVFVENILKIDKKDIREWFNVNGNSEVPRINTIGLFSAIEEQSGSDTIYKDVRLFSKLNIHNDVYDSPHKTMTWIYRIFTA